MIEKMKQAAVDKILQAIKVQRWYFIENNPKIFIDKNYYFTVWANLEHFPYKKSDDTWYESDNSYEEVKNLLAEINLQSWGGFNSWSIPTVDTLFDGIRDRTFPFLGTSTFYDGNTYEIKDMFSWCVDYYKDDKYNLASKCLYYDITHDTDYSINISFDTAVCVIPSCNSLIVPNDYYINVAPSYNFYSETEKLQFTLDVFIQNNLIPIFKDYHITELYKIIFVDKQLYRLIFFDELLFAGYDMAAIEKSAIKYFDAVVNLADTMLDTLREYESANESAISELLRVALKLKLKFTENPHLTHEENSLLSERQKFLAQRLSMGTNEVKDKILLIKAQVERFFRRLDEINLSANSITELVELEKEPRIKFEFLIENLARIVREAQCSMNFFVQNKEFVTNVVNAQVAWSDSYKAFKTSLREELMAAYRNDSIDDEVFAAWYDDWQTKRFAIEQRFMPLVEFALKGNLLDATDGVLKTLQGYRDAVDKFYLHERKNIYQKFAFVPGGDLQEKFETESELYKLAEKFQRDLQGIIFACDKTEERIFLLRWAEPILNLPIDEISNFIRDKELDTIAEEVLTQLAELKRKNFAEYLADSKAYSDAAQKREKEFNALIFRMRKELNKK